MLINLRSAIYPSELGSLLAHVIAPSTWKILVPTVDVKNKATNLLVSSSYQAYRRETLPSARLLEFTVC